VQQELALDGIGCKIRSSPICEVRLPGTPRAAEQIGSGRMEQVITIQLLGERFYEREPGVRPVGTAVSLH